MKFRLSSICLSKSLAVLCLGSAISASAAQLEDSRKVTEQTNKAGSASQQKIENLSRETRALLDEYKKLLHNAEYQDAYNKELQRLKEEQEAQISSLQEQINEIEVTQQRIMPLMNSMAETLEEFILLDLPFHQEQRLSSVLVLKQQIKSASIPTPDKMRSVWEAYQIETDYGRTIETWRGPLNTDGTERSVEFLRVGRIALFYQTLDGEESGYWTASAKGWKPLPDSYNSSIKQGIRVASNQLAPQLLNLPLASTQSAQEK